MAPINRLSAYFSAENPRPPDARKPGFPRSIPPPSCPSLDTHPADPRSSLPHDPSLDPRPLNPPAGSPILDPIGRDELRRAIEIYWECQYHLIRVRRLVAERDPLGMDAGPAGRNQWEILAQIETDDAEKRLIDAILAAHGYDVSSPRGVMLGEDVYIVAPDRETERLRLWTMGMEEFLRL